MYINSSELALDSTGYKLKDSKCEKAQKIVERLFGFFLHHKSAFVKAVIIAAVWILYSVPLIVFHTANTSVTHVASMHSA